MASDQIGKLLEALGADDDQLFKLHILEVVGTLALMIHHLRGRMSWLTHSDAVQMSSGAKEEYARMDTLVAQLEPIVWAIAPPRAMLMELAKFRETGELSDDWEVLLPKDLRGRIPEDGPPVDDTQMEEVLNRLKDYRTGVNVEED